VIRLRSPDPSVPLCPCDYVHLTPLSSAGDDGIVIVEIGEPSNIVHTIPTPDTAYSVVLSEDETRLYVANGQSGIVVIMLVE